MDSSTEFAEFGVFLNVELSARRPRRLRGELSGLSPPASRRCNLDLIDDSFRPLRLPLQ